MRIRFLSFMGVRGLDGVQKDLPHKDLDLIVVHGAYGRGKTGFLDTIAAAKESIGEYGSSDQRWDALIASQTGAAKVRMDWEPSEAERSRAGSSETLLLGEAILGRALLPPQNPSLLKALLSQKSDGDRGSVHYLQDNRDLAGPLSYGAADTAFSERLTTRNTKYSELFDMLDQPQYAAGRELANKRLAELFPQLEIVGLKRSGITFVPALRNRETGGERTWHTLTSSEKQAFLISLYVSKAPIVDSVLLFDAPELGFGDEGAVQIVRALLRWTTKTQIFVATASNAVRAMPEVAHIIELP